jgi:hypothetical protein
LQPLVSCVHCQNRKILPPLLALFRQLGNGGWGGIRTHEGLAPLPVFKTGAFNRSATHPFPAGPTCGRLKS